MDVPPPELFARNRLAFMLMTYLHEHPTRDLTTADAARTLRCSSPEARDALAELTALGVLEQPRRGHYREPVPKPPRQLPPRACRRCGQLIPEPLGKKIFCSRDCKILWHRGNIAAQRQAARDPEIGTCVICGSVIPVKPRTARLLYCSRHCKHIAALRRAADAAAEAGTAGTCATCGRPTVSPARSWCSTECRTQNAGGKGQALG